jgi:folate-binding protein YgfZ
MMLEITAFETFVPVLISGSDALGFMQGQITADLRKLGPTEAVFGACCNAQGRVQTLVTVLKRQEGIVLLLQFEMAERMLDRFRAATLSSKVSFERAPWVITPLFGESATRLGHDLPGAPGACKTFGDATWLRFWGAEERYLVIGPAAAFRTLVEGGSAVALAWRRGDVMSGLPWIHAATQNSFVPQTINLDLLGGVSFDKGCYVGQEVVARARRSGVHRRMFGFSSACAPPAPGTEVVSDGDVVGEVVDAVSFGAGARLLVAVDLGRTAAQLSLRDIANSQLTAVRLPYGVPLDRAPDGARKGWL